ncbi:AraC family transcriptional regulator [Streptomyces longwoodensis]|uniref:helix-turn-helix transcriptional regulator n=1 Tax=Streptomyces longwoodensis TaxID=68231 RepID=UPI0022579053|nr:AraC family transcriptional regulator [Streptomyces longwoodensis]MCX4994479.1 AraC family transcriptional regulator [Streptomyces longwoodensis]WTI46413.1 AraC family transcriptional regulator [Streptomyces longwoodensis]WUC59178.1 AraC family transcriptional regulator [Streptomyces longwoodensis]
MAARQEVTAWRPRVRGVTEVFHAHFTEYAYPMHVHDAWTLLIVDDGAVRYDLERHEHGTPHDTVSLLPPHVPHNGAPATPHGFRKRVVYLDASVLGEDLIGAAVDGPDLRDALLRRRVGQLHTALAQPGDELEAESRLTFVAEHLRERLDERLRPAGRDARDPALARRLRELLDAHVTDGVTLEEAARLLHAHPAHLVRAFSGAYGIAPHQYLTSRRVGRARRLLLDGLPPGEVATTTGFFDQAHLTRHFRKLVGVTPGRYRRSAR